MEIIAGGPHDPRVVALLEAHLTRAHAESPLCSVHALDIGALKAPGISFCTGWESGEPLVTGAL
jgi:putative acetyltransferase